MTCKHRLCVTQHSAAFGLLQAEWQIPLQASCAAHAGPAMLGSGIEAATHIKENTDIRFGDGRVQASQLHPALLNGNHSLVDAAIHEARQGRIGLHLPCHGGVQGCHTSNVDGQGSHGVHSCRQQQHNMSPVLMLHNMCVWCQMHVRRVYEDVILAGRMKALDTETLSESQEPSFVTHVVIWNEAVYMQKL